jgi:hypothetical protein
VSFSSTPFEPPNEHTSNSCNRLKMNFIDLGDPTADAGLNRQKCPVLAWSYSDPFQVFSAKKFPGVIESTPLSKAFATQGIKIPIRKEGRPEKEEVEED